MGDSVSQRAIQRLKDEMNRRNLSQLDLAGLLQWEQSRVSKILNERIELKVEDLAALCFALGVSLVEVVRDPGLEFVAEMSPTELRFLERVRQMPPPVREAFLVAVTWQRGVTGKVERYAKKPKPILGEPKAPRQK